MTDELSQTEARIVDPSKKETGLVRVSATVGDRPNRLMAVPT